MTRIVIVRRLGAEDADLFKTLRLRALADAPDAFAHSYAEISAKPDAYWVEMTRSVTAPDRYVMFVAEDAAAPAGMAFGLIDREDPALAGLGGMWVAPDARGRGIGRALGDAVIVWARARGFGGVVLWVTNGNEPAIALYERLGFDATGCRDRPPVDECRQVIEMRLTLRARPP